ncbi:MAG: ABC transporter ATP-binding protein, partial [Chloroflexi bacterium]|nr:ABC transporter ATP-binding protein [Chloroflexota bacterium]
MLKILRHLPRNLWWAVVLCLVLVVAQVWLDLKIPGYMSEITTIVMTAGSTTSQVLAIGGQMLLCALGSLASSITVGYFAARIAASFAHRLRELQFKQVMSFSSEQLGKFSTASLITRSTNDVTHVQMVISMGLQIIIKAPIMAVWAILKIASKSWEWTGITALAVLVLIAIITVIIIFVVPKFKQIQLLTDKLNSVARENLTGLRVVHAYNAEEYQQQKFAKVNEELTSTNLFVNRMSAILQPGMSLISNGLVLAVYWVGAVLIANTVATGRLELFSDMVVFSSYAMQVVMSFMMMTMIFIMVPRAQVSANRINEVLDTQPNIFDGPAEEGLPGLKGLVEFKNVSFKYPEAAEYVIQDISFTVNSGETVAFIGSTGSGKSTLI